MLKPTTALLCFCFTFSCAKTASSPQDESSYAQAVQLLCDVPKEVRATVGDVPPPERQAALAARKPPEIRNAKVARLAAEIVTLPARQAVARLGLAAKEAGIEECLLAIEMQSTIPLEPLTTVDGWLEPLAPMPTLQITQEAVSLHDSYTQSPGTVLVPIRDGKLVGALDRFVLARVTAALDALPPAPESRGGVRTFSVGGEGRRVIGILAGPEVPYEHVFRVIASARDFLPSFILRGSAGQFGTIPLHFPKPEMRDPNAPATDEAPPIALILTVLESRFLLWSVSGQEGDLREPKLERPKKAGTYDYAALSTALAEIVDRRWPKGTSRKQADYQIIVQAAAAIPFADIARFATTVRGSSQETPLFPLLMLAKPSFD